MINGYPTEEELRLRISRQLRWRGESDTVALIWHGYLAGLMEWGLIEIYVYDRLTALLTPTGKNELSELFSDEPLSATREMEIDEFAKRHANSQSNGNDDQ